MRCVDTYCSLDFSPSFHKVKILSLDLAETWKWSILVTIRYLSVYGSLAAFTPLLIAWNLRHRAWTTNLLMKSAVRVIWTYSSRAKSHILMIRSVQSIGSWIGWASCIRIQLLTPTINRVVEIVANGWGSTWVILRVVVLWPLIIVIVI